MCSYRTGPECLPLEPRLVLSAPLPDITLLEDPVNPVARIETDLGAIDVELFDQLAPGAVGAFLAQLRDGRVDESFFDSLQPGDTLGAGLLKLDGFLPVTIGQPVAPGDSPRSNAERTLAMAAPADGAADGRWTINLRDNPDRDATHTVFGRIIQGWDVVMQIGALGTAVFIPPDPALQALMTQVPVFATSISRPLSAINDDLVVNLIDVELIKPGGATVFYTQRLAYPEGFGGFQKREILSIAESSGFLTHYQLIVRYEFGDRDAVVAEGSLAPNQRLDVSLSDWFDDQPDLVRPDQPYTVEVHAAADPGSLAVIPPQEPLTATLTRQDGFFRFDDPLQPGHAIPQTGETLFSLAAIEGQDLTTWGFGSIPFGSSSSCQRDLVCTLTQRQSAITLHNLSDQDARVAMTLFVRSSQGQVIEVVENFTVEAMRRGGRLLADVALPAGAHQIEGAIIESTEPLLAQLSAYHQRITSDEVAGDRFDHQRGAWAAKGVVGGGAAAGIIAQLRLPNMFPLSVFNPHDAAVGVELEFIRADGAIESQRFEVAGRADREIAFIPDFPVRPGGEFIAVRYTAELPVIVEQARTTGGADGGVAGTAHLATTRLGFAWAERPEDARDEIISVFDPSFETAPGNTVRLRFGFNDGSVVFVDEIGLGPGGRIDLTLDHDLLGAVREKLDSDPALGAYSVTIEASGGPVFAWLHRIDGAGGRSTTTAAQPLVFRPTPALMT